MLTQIVYQLRFTGGPFDGLRVYSTDLPDTRFAVPLRPDGQPDGALGL